VNARSTKATRSNKKAAVRRYIDDEAVERYVIVAETHDLLMLWAAREIPLILMVMITRMFRSFLFHCLLILFLEKSTRMEMISKALTGMFAAICAEFRLIPCTFTGRSSAPIEALVKKPVGRPKGSGKARASS
jgi:hypothetical protein